MIRAWTRLRIVIAACGPAALLLGMPTPVHAEFPPTACGLLSAGEVEQALHVPVSNGSPRVNTEILTSCVFTDGRGGVVSILLRRNTSQDWTTEQRRRMSGSFRPFAGLGDSAFVLDRREQGAALCVFRGEYYLQISIFQVGSADAVLPAAEDLARKALSRL